MQTDKSTPKQTFDFFAERRIVPTSEHILHCGVALEQRGWHRSAVGDVNFDKGAKAWAYALKNNMGILVVGPTGTGKTSYIRAITEAHRRNHTLREFDFKTNPNVEILDRLAYPESVERLMNYHLLIDDLGAELPVNDYGVKREIALDFITYYSAHGTGNLYITSNFYKSGDDPKSFYTRYSTRIEFIKEKVVLVKFEGRSMRQWILAI